MKIFLLSACLFLTSCGESPLFNHTNEKRGGLGRILQDQNAVYTLGISSFSLDWIDGPEKGTSKFIMNIWQEGVGTFNGPYQDLPGDLAISIFMPAMGHGSSPVKITKLAVGEYEVSEINFFMGGTWEVKFQNKESGHVHDESVLSYSL